MFPSHFLRLAEVVLMQARESKLRIATAESCTGGLIAGLLTEIPGSSDVLDRGFVAYSNRAKRDMLGVPGDHIAACRERRSILHEAHRFGDIGRSEVRMKTVEAALELLQRLL
jgi:nicotinamide-nucleotide amidase